VELINKLDKDLNFFYSYPRIWITFHAHIVHNSLSYVLKCIDIFSKKHKKFYIVTPHEIIRNELILESLIQKIMHMNNSGYEIYISMTSTTENSSFLHPLISLLHYINFKKIRNGFQYNTDENCDEFIYLGDLDLYSDSVYRINKSIFSLREKTNIRDLVNNKINSNFDGIYRYLNNDINQYKKAPTFTSLINEYKSSFISYLFETEPSGYLNTFTEKSIICFGTKTLPILFLITPTQLDEFEKLGFYFLNREIGYVYNENIVDNFVNYVKIINTMHIDDVKNLYKINLDKIENNYKIIENVLKYQKEEYSNKTLVVKTLF
jgi:hypothetical protein